MADIARVQYAERQFLRAADFRLEQEYHRDGGRRHLLGAHTWGIVVGLELLEVPVPNGTDEVEVVLQPGLAVDGYGRELVAFEPLRLDRAAFERFVDDAHRQVWLAYDEQTSDSPGDGRPDCEEADERRVTERIRLVVEPKPPVRDEVLVNGVAAMPAPAAAGTPELPADTSVPYQELPDLESTRWLVRLGDVRWDGAAGVFRAADEGRLTRDRRHAGLVADHVLGAAGTLRVAPRKPAADPDLAEFARVEGRLRVQGRINAERELWMEGEPVRFTYDTGAEDDVVLSLGRRRPPSGTGNDLRVRVGDDTEGENRFVVGTGGGPPANAPPVDLFTVADDDVVSIPTGLLRFGDTLRQMIDLWASADDEHEYGIGIQSGTLYQRSGAQFCWFRGGKHANGASDPGDDGTLAMKLDSGSRLSVFGDVTVGSGGDGALRVRRILGKRWESDALDHLFLQWDTGLDVWVGRPGYNPSDVLVSGELTVGAGGDAPLRTRHIFGKRSGNDLHDNLYLQWNTGYDVFVGAPNFSFSSLHVSGSLRVHRDLHVHGDAKSVFHVYTVPRAVANNPGSWTVNLPPGEFTEVTVAFAVLQGFSLWNNHDNPAFTNSGHVESDNAIPQHVVVRVNPNWTTAQVTGNVFCSESDASLQGDNTVLFTLVVLGRRIA